MSEAQFITTVYSTHTAKVSVLIRKFKEFSKFISNHLCDFSQVMFLRYDEVPDHFGSITLPPSFTYDITSKRYTNAAESLVRHQVPFNYSFIFLSNCPEALTEYIFLSIKCFDQDDYGSKVCFDIDLKSKEGKNEKKEKSESIKKLSSKESSKKKKKSKKGKKEIEMKQLVINEISSYDSLYINLYLSLIIPIIHIEPEEKRMNDITKILKLIKKYKIAISKVQLYQLCKKLSNDDIYAGVCLIFDDIWEYSMIMLEKNNYDAVFEQLHQLSESKRAQVYCAFPQEYQKSIVACWLNGELPNAATVLPLLADTIFADELNTEITKPLQNVLEKMFLLKQLLTAPQKQLFFHTIVKNGNFGNLQIIYKHDSFKSIGYYFILRYLSSHKQFSIAAKFCAYIDLHHHAAVDFAIHDSINSCHDLLNNELKDAFDIRSCWIKAINQTKDVKGAEVIDWKNLIQDATVSNVVKLTDVLPVLPYDMPINVFQPTILKTVDEYQDKSKKNSDQVESVANRSSIHRNIIQKGTKITYNVDPVASCWFCQNSIYKEKFIVFQCNHMFHIKCYFNSMHIYYEPEERLQLISTTLLASRYPKKEENLQHYICDSCPICGERAINEIGKDFLTRREASANDIWDLPPVE
ncbi:hypothetical protein TRFO_42351 [Tritrichomonas foetus]|uniref:RING-type domain-containing protein n=1 Tax=Tritrichomonas foetus TaxID=1144522 RepID=A0A1J4L1A0_9EUKA|nr:hypothetical protein TRFO_42351 [Tritrichomonas foetus]|eukprot:OHT15740.1 hypothetical protein TRFO_42351 [Tritrichomonas foetus]